MVDKRLWLGNLIFRCKHKLTTKDKLVASYLFFSPEFKEGNCYKIPTKYQSVAHAISYFSGLKVRTVQKSLGRLSAIGAITFITDYHFILETVNE